MSTPVSRIASSQLAPAGVAVAVLVAAVVLAVAGVALGVAVVLGVD
jgi:hypothetical protein